MNASREAGGANKISCADDQDLANQSFILGIDATNLRHGGGLTHLIELLEHANPTDHGFDQVIVWGGEQLHAIKPQPWLKKAIVVSESDTYFQRTSWARRNLVRQARIASCDLLFTPGGTFATKSMPYVSMSQNMLLYDDDERRRFPWGRNRIRYNLLRLAQRKSFLHANGIVFISQYAENAISRRFPFVQKKMSTVIYHGVSSRFSAERPRRDHRSPIRLLYVSRVNHYKHQWNVIEAVQRLRDKNIPVTLRLVGETNASLESRMSQAMQGIEPDVVQIVGEVPYDEIEREYQEADVFVFASTCENMPNILVEAMAAGLPVACSNYGPMPEILGDAGVYFDPLSIESIETAIESLTTNSELRKVLSQRSLHRAADFSWTRTATETFEFLNQCLSQHVRIC